MLNFWDMFFNCAKFDQIKIRHIQTTFRRRLRAYRQKSMSIMNQLMFDELKKTIDINEMSDVEADTKKKKFNEIDFFWKWLSLYADIKNAFNVINIYYLIIVIKSSSYLYERYFSKHFHQIHHNYFHICINVIF